MPFICAVPIGLPPVEQFGPIPSAGPYYISAYGINQHTHREPESELPRPAAAALRHARVRLQPERGDGLPAGRCPATWTAARFRPPMSSGRPAVRPGQPRRRARASAVLPEPDRAASDTPVEHRAPAVCGREHAQGGELRGRPHGYGAPPARTRRRRSTSTSRRACPGYEDIQVYPDHPDLERARDLAGWHPGDPLRPITVYYRSSGPTNPAQYQIVRQNLMDIGFDVTGVGSPGGNIYTAWAPRRAVRPRRERRLVRGLPRPVGLHAALRRDDDPRRQNNINYSYFNDPVFNDRMHAANELVGDERYDAFRQIEHDLVRDAAPSAAMRTYNNRYFFSQRMGCQHLQARRIEHRPDHLCVRPGDHDRRRASLEPASGRRSSTFPCA